MPKYVYRCVECGFEFETTHRMDERREDCPECEIKKVLVRVPCFAHLYNKLRQPNDKKDGEAPPGDAVKDFIRDTKREVDEMKEEYRLEEMKPDGTSN